MTVHADTSAPMVRIKPGGAWPPRLSRWRDLWAHLHGYTVARCGTCGFWAQYKCPGQGLEQTSAALRALHDRYDSDHEVTP